MKVLLSTFLSCLFGLSVLTAQPQMPESPTEKPSAEIIIVDNYQEVKSFEELVKPYRGKVIYADIWATWCGPCRQQFDYADELKTFAEGKDIVFLYISVDKVPKEKQWKAFINEWGIEGYHAQAHPDLKDDLVQNFYAGVKRGRKYLSLPTFIIVDKKGKIVNADARRPSEGKKLYKQLDKYLKK